MKTNKKAFFGFAIAMIFSLAFMQGISTKNTNQDMTRQQVAYGCTYMADGEQNGWSTTSGIAQGVCGGFIVCGVTNVWNPGGWVAWGCAGVSAL